MTAALDAAFRELSTPLVFDACWRLEVPHRCAPAGVRPVVAAAPDPAAPGGVREAKAAGRALPVRHYGSVDVFLEAYEQAEPGDVLVIDNGGRADEGCIGDLTVLEARAAGLAGVFVWGFHRDTAELAAIGFPVFTYGACPLGPRRLDERGSEALASARCGDFEVTRDDVVLADSDGVLFVARERVDEVLSAARAIRAAERRQAAAVASGTTLRDQLRFAEFLRARARDPAHTFRAHLRRIGGAIEE